MAANAAIYSPFAAFLDRAAKIRQLLQGSLPESQSKVSKEALIKSLSDFILVFLFNARNKSTRIASYLRRLMTQHWIKIHMKFDSAN